jgi:hypothetical protein
MVCDDIELPRRVSRRIVSAAALPIIAYAPDRFFRCAASPAAAAELGAEIAGGHEGMAVQHARSGVPHDPAYFFPHVRSVTVNPAVGAHRLVRLQRADCQPLPGVG